MGRRFFLPTPRAFMITVQLTLDDQTVSDTIAAATKAGFSFNEYVEWRLNVELDAAIDQAQPAEQLSQNVEKIARELLDFASTQQAQDDGDCGEYIVEAKPYLVEDLYKRRKSGTAWNLLDRGHRIMIGKAFKRLVDKEYVHDVESIQVRIVRDGLTAQNQTRYKTVRY